MYRNQLYTSKKRSWPGKIFFLILICSGWAAAQESPRYLVLFKDKTGTPFTVSQPEAFLSERAVARRGRQNIPVTEADLPVNPAYVTAVSATGALVLHSSRWFNGVVVSASESQLQAIRELPFYKGIERGMALTGAGYSGRTAQADRKFGENAAIDYGTSRLQLEMLGVPSLHEMGYTGSGILIGVLDSGFTRADEQGYLAHLYENGQVADTYDFISRNSNVYNDHNHGLQVLSVMASRWEGNLIGAAFDASYALYRTENVFSETPYEEVSWLLAAERADSLGVDIINTSLGYYSFDNSDHDYTYAQMDGKTAIISRAARYAARAGILVVASAGNEGSNSWKYITAPADVDSVLTVGAVTSAGDRSSFSSIGPNAENVIKPDVAALGSGVRLGSASGTVTSSNGTSFSAPLIASFSALLWQLYPEKTALEMADLIRSIGSRASDPDNETGYGIPYYDQVLNINSPIGFSASLSGNIVDLSWEYPDAGIAVAYEIERSFNNGTFARLASVNTPRYSGDTLLLPGTYRYRVRAASDYQYSAYSSITGVEFTITGKEPAFSFAPVRPNPAQHSIFADLRPFGNDAVVSARIITPGGITVISRELSAAPSGITEIEISSLPPGLYILKLTSGNGNEVSLQKFVKF